MSGRDSEEVGVERLCAEVAHDYQRDVEEQDAVADRGQSVGLIFKAGADPSFCDAWLSMIYRTVPTARAECIGSGIPSRFPMNSISAHA